MSAVLENKNIREKQFVERTMKVGDSVISYNASERQHKKALILQHGAIINSLTMMGLAQMFNDYSVFVPDLPNHGKSTAPFNVDTVEKFTDIEFEFIEKLKETGEIDKDADITYAGWSLGGSIGLELALKKEKVMNRLVLISSSPVWKTMPVLTEDQIRGMISQIPSFMSGDTKPEMLKWIKENYELMGAKPSVGVQDSIAINSFNVISKLKDIDVPVLMVSGDDDVLALPECQRLMAENIPNAKLVMFKGESHFLVVGCPEKVYKEITEFMKESQKKAVAAV